MLKYPASVWCTVPIAALPITTLVVRASRRLERDEGDMMTKSTDRLCAAGRLLVARIGVSSD